MKQAAHLSVALPAEEDSKQGERWRTTLGAVYLPAPRDMNVRTASITAMLTDKPNHKEHWSKLPGAKDSRQTEQVGDGNCKQLININY